MLEAQAQILESMQQEPRMSQRATPHMQALPVNRTLQHGGPERLFYLKHFMSPEEVNLMLTGGRVLPPREAPLALPPA